MVVLMELSGMSDADDLYEWLKTCPTKWEDDDTKIKEDDEGYIRISFLVRPDWEDESE